MLGVIGGSGLYDIPELQVLDRVSVETPWGAPSDLLTIGQVGEYEGRFPATAWRRSSSHTQRAPVPGQYLRFQGHRGYASSDDQRGWQPERGAASTNHRPTRPDHRPNLSTASFILWGRRCGACGHR